MAGANRTKWTKDPTAQIPQEIVDLARKWGPRLRDRSASQKNLRVEEEVSKYKARLVIDLALDNTAHEAPQESAPADSSSLWEETAEAEPFPDVMDETAPVAGELALNRDALEDAGFSFDSSGSIKSAPIFDRWDRDGDLEADDDFFEETEEDWDEPIEDIIARQKKRFERRAASGLGDGVIRKHLQLQGPFAICHLGDPHVDDSGCDWPELLRVLEIIGKTPGMVGANIGDHTNNWVGRLQKLWGKQHTTVREAHRIGRWVLRRNPSISAAYSISQYV